MTDLSLLAVTLVLMLRGTDAFVRRGIERRGDRLPHRLDPRQDLALSTAVDALAIVAILAMFLASGWSLAALRAGLLTLLVASAAKTDFRWGIIPNRLVATGITFGIVLAAAVPSGLPDYLLAASASAFAVLAIRLLGSVVFGRAGMGMGDAKLAAAAGIFLGWHALWMLYLAVIIGGLAGVVMLHRSGHGGKLPFAPCMALATALQVTVLPAAVVMPW